MIINHNMQAMNTHRQMGNVASAQNKSMEKLSSGYRINRAGDDAAGLAISEKMRAQIKGLGQASRNAQDGISLVQTAEGALSETQNILQRMRELSVQSANDTNVDADRTAIQNEVDQLAQEITRVANNTEFNNRTLLNGALKDTTGLGEVRFHIGANAGQGVNLGIGAMDASSLGVARDVVNSSVAAGAQDLVGVELGTSVGTAVVNGAALALTANDTAAQTTWSAGDSGLTGTTLTSTSNSSTYNDYTITTSISGATSAAIDTVNKTITLTIVTGGADTAANLQTELDNAGILLTATGDTTAVVPATNAAATSAGLAADEVSLTFNGDTKIVKDNATSATFTSVANKGVTLKFDGGLTAATAGTVNIGTDVASAATFSGGVTTAAKASGGLDISTQSAADTAITTITNALTKVSDERAKLGAVQNRLEHTISNLDTSAENLQASESRIRDVDMAKEMMEFTKNNILSQAAQSMLAQANQAPQGVLQLLR